MGTIKWGIIQGPVGEPKSIDSNNNILIFEKSNNIVRILYIWNPVKNTMSAPNSGATINTKGELVSINHSSILNGFILFVNENGSVLFRHNNNIFLQKDKINYFINSIENSIEYSYWLNDLDEVVILFRNQLSIWKCPSEISQFQLNESNGRIVGFTNSRQILIKISNGNSYFDKLLLLKIEN